MLCQMVLITGHCRATGVSLCVQAELSNCKVVTKTDDKSNQLKYLHVVDNLSS